MDFFLMPFNQEELIETFNVLQLIGFLLICLGAFIYNGLFKLEERLERNNKKKIELKKLDDIQEEKFIDSQRQTIDE
jgi:hypothetical protein